MHIESVERDDERAFSEWAASRLGSLVRFGFALTHDEGGAEDLVASALARTLLVWPAVRERGDPEHFARRAMVNELGSRRRRRRRAEVHIDLTVAEVGAHLWFDTEQAELAERDRIWRELVNVAPRPRAVLVLRYYEGRSEREVAEILGCTVDSVRESAAAALATLRAGEVLELAVTRRD